MRARRSVSWRERHERPTVPEKLPQPIDVMYHFSNGETLTIPGVVRTVSLENGITGHVSADGYKWTIAPGWLAMATTGAVDWE